MNYTLMTMKGVAVAYAFVQSIVAAGLSYSLRVSGSKKGTTIYSLRNTTSRTAPSGRQSQERCGRMREERSDNNNKYTAQCATGI